MTPIHGPLVTLCYYFIFCITLASPLTVNAFNVNTIFYYFQLISALLLNANWLLTSIAILMNLIGALTAYNIHHFIFNVNQNIIFILTTLVVIYAVWNNEQMLKNDFLHLKQIEVMSNDVQNLLLNLPLPLLVLDSDD